ncbi:MAG: porin family protein [Bacteroidota bacterium]
MKEISLLVLIFSVSISFSQFNDNPVINLENYDKPFLNYGYSLGVNQYDFQFEYKNDGPDVLVQRSIGFNVGLIGEMRINKFLDIRFEPNLLYTQRNLGFPGFDNERDALREVRSTYINFPLILKISTLRYGNWKPFISGGFYTAINLGSEEDSLDDNSSGTFRMKRNVQGYELGFGIEFYTEYFKFTPTIRGVFALTNEIVPDQDPNSPWTGNIEAMRTRGVFLSFIFE